MTAIGIGATVRLKTGGPNMTIVENGDGNEWCTHKTLYRWRCAWFEETTLRTITLPAGALELVTNSPVPNPPSAPCSPTRAHTGAGQRG